MNKKWSDYLWIGELLFFALSFFNVLFAWLGMIFFVTPLLFAIIGKNKAYCNHYCGRGQLFNLIGSRIKISKSRPAPKFLRSKWFRYGFLIFFMTMFGQMVFGTYKVFTGMSLQEVVSLFWTFKLPWQFIDVSIVSPWVAQFAFGFFSLMLTSSLLGMISLLFYRPRTFCVFCPMGTMTQGICQLRNYGNLKEKELI